MSNVILFPGANIQFKRILCEVCEDEVKATEAADHKAMCLRTQVFTQEMYRWEELTHSGDFY